MTFATDALAAMRPWPGPLAWPGLPGGIAACLMPIGLASADTRFVEEMAPIAHAVPRRCAEFIAGRACARLALATLGVAPQAIPAAADRSPCWPSGYVGSISHSATHAIALAANADRVAGLGVDLEPALPLDPALDTMIVHAQDQPCCNGDGLASKRIFVAKEAYYKALYPQRMQFLDFMDVTIDLASATGSTFRAALRSDGANAMNGTIMIVAGHLVAVVVHHRSVATP